MLGDQVGFYGPNDFEVVLDSIEIQQRYAEFMRRRDGDRSRVGEVLVDQVGDQRHFVFLGSLGRLEQLFLRDDTVLDETSRQASQVGL